MSLCFPPIVPHGAITCYFFLEENTVFILGLLGERYKVLPNIPQTSIGCWFIGMSFCFILDLAWRTITCRFFLEIHRKGLRKFIPKNKIKWGKSSSRRRWKYREVVSLKCVSNFLMFFEEDLFGCCWTWKLHFLGFGIVGGREIFVLFPGYWAFQWF